MEDIRCEKFVPSSRELDKAAVILRMEQELGFPLTECEEFDMPAIMDGEPDWFCIALNSKKAQWVFWKWEKDGTSRVRCVDTLTVSGISTVAKPSEKFHQESVVTQDVERQDTIHPESRDPEATSDVLANTHTVMRSFFWRLVTLLWVAGATIAIVQSCNQKNSVPIQNQQKAP